MAESWFYSPVLHTGEVALAAAETRHALQSRRLPAGAPVVLFDGQGRVGHGTLSPAPRRAGKRDPVVVTVQRIEQQPRPVSALTLVVAGCKGPRLDVLIEKCTELGVAGLVFAAFERSVVRLRAEQVGGLLRTAVEACKQCRRAWLPEIRVCAGLEEAVAGLGGPRLVAHPVEGVPHLGRRISRAGPVTVVIGPEGGLSEREVEYLVRGGAELVGLGPYVLRVETAALAAAAAWSAAPE